MKAIYRVSDVTRSDLKEEFERLESLIEKSKERLDKLWRQFENKEITHEEFTKKFDRLDKKISTLEKNFHRTKMKWLAESPYSYLICIENIGRK